MHPPPAHGLYLSNAGARWSHHSSPVLAWGEAATQAKVNRLAIESQHAALVEVQSRGNIPLQLRLFTAAFLLQAKMADATGPPLGRSRVLRLNANERSYAFRHPRPFALCSDRGQPSYVYVTSSGRAT